MGPGPEIRKLVLDITKIINLINKAYQTGNSYFLSPTEVRQMKKVSWKQAIFLVVACLAFSQPGLGQARPTEAPTAFETLKPTVAPTPYPSRQPNVPTIPGQAEAAGDGAYVSPGTIAAIVGGSGGAVLLGAGVLIWRHKRLKKPQLSLEAIGRKSSYLQDSLATL